MRGRNAFFVSCRHGRGMWWSWVQNPKTDPQGQCGFIRDSTAHSQLPVSSSFACWEVLLCVLGVIETQPCSPQKATHCICAMDVLCLASPFIKIILHFLGLPVKVPREKGKRVSWGRGREMIRRNTWAKQRANLQFALGKLRRNAQL